MIERRSFLGSIGACSIAFALGGGRAVAAGRDAVAANLDRYLLPFAARRDFSGYVLLSRGDEIIASRSYGFADFERRTANTADTGFMTASIGKMFTRSALIELSRQKQLSPTDHLARFLPDFPNAGAITIENLLDHQSGIARDLPPDTGLSKSRSLDELVAIIAAQPAVGKPGESSSYSNNGYRLLAKVIEVAGRGSYDDLVRELVFEPRGMRNTLSGVDPAKAKRWATGYRPGPSWNSIEREPAVSLSNERGAGSFYVTASDMLRFLRTLPLERDDLESAPRVDPQGKPKPRSVGHDGFGSGFANLAYAYPDERAAMVLLGNIQSGLFTPLHGDLRRILFGESVPPPTLPEIEEGIGAAPLSSYEGDYEFRPGNPLRLRVRRQGLTVNGGEGEHPLLPIGPNRFFMRLRYATLSFEEIAAGKAGLLRWAEGGGEFPMKRLA